MQKKIPEFCQKFCISEAANSTRCSSNSLNLFLGSPGSAATPEKQMWFSSFMSDHSGQLLEEHLWTPEGTTSITTEQKTGQLQQKALCSDKSRREDYLQFHAESPQAGIKFGINCVMFCISH